MANMTHTLEHQQNPPLPRGTAENLWIPGATLRIHREKRFCFSSQFGFGVFPVTSHIMEVFPPDVLVQQMIQSRIGEPGSASRHEVGFAATITISCLANAIFTTITLKSLRGGIYARESVVPEGMLCIRRDARETVIASLNRAMLEKNWSPSY